MAVAPAYVRHHPEDTVLYAVVEEHAEAFFARLGEQGASLPAFVHEEFARYLRCGRLEEGFVRVACTGCRHEYLHRVAPPAAEELERLLDTVICR